MLVAWPCRSCEVLELADKSPLTAVSATSCSLGDSLLAGEVIPSLALLSLSVGRAALLTAAASLVRFAKLVLRPSQNSVGLGQVLKSIGRTVPIILCILLGVSWEWVLMRAPAEEGFEASMNENARFSFLCGTGGGEVADG